MYRTLLSMPRTAARGVYLSGSDQVGAMSAQKRAELDEQAPGTSDISNRLVTSCAETPYRLSLTSSQISHTNHICEAHHHPLFSLSPDAPNLFPYFILPPIPGGDARSKLY